jgi:hypothetical protein
MKLKVKVETETKNTFDFRKYDYVENVHQVTSVLDEKELNLLKKIGKEIGKDSDKFNGSMLRAINTASNIIPFIAQTEFDQADLPIHALFDAPFCRQIESVQLYPLQRMLRWRVGQYAKISKFNFASIYPSPDVFKGILTAVYRESPTIAEINVGCLAEYTTVRKALLELSELIDVGKSQHFDERYDCEDLCSFAFVKADSLRYILERCVFVFANADNYLRSKGITSYDRSNNTKKCSCNKKCNKTNKK